MALEGIPQVQNALSQLFAPDFARQFNNQATLASNLTVRPGRGKNAAWDVGFTGATAGTVAEGSDVQAAEFTTNPPQPAILSWATYRSSFQITENEIDAAVSSMGTAAALMDLFGERVYNANTKLAQAINIDSYIANGTDGGGNPTIVGLFGGSTDPTGTYAGLSRGTFPEWAGNQLGNGGVQRPLTLDLLYQADQQIYVASGEPGTKIFCSPGIYRKYANIFEAGRRTMTGGAQPTVMGAGGQPSVAYNPQQSDLYFRNMPVIRDRNCPTNKLIITNENYLELQFLPHINPGDAFGYNAMTASGTSGGSGPTGNSIQTPTSLPVRIVLLAKTGDSVKASVKAVCAMVVRRPNSFCQITDISEV